MKNMTIQASKITGSVERFETEWVRISDDVAAAFRMTEDEKSWLKNKGIAKLIAAIPVLAGCEDAERTGVTHLAIYLLSIRETKHYFNALPADNTDFFERLRLGNNFKGGDRDIIKRGMSILALHMLEDYKRDIHIDEAVGKYNPVGDGVFNYESVKRELEEGISVVDCPEMDEIYGSDPGAGPRGYWGV